VQEQLPQSATSEIYYLLLLILLTELVTEYIRYRWRLSTQLRKCYLSPEFVVVSIFELEETDRQCDYRYY
jgi:hypothetical protein